MNPEVPWRPARFLTTDFIQPHNVIVAEEARKLREPCATDDDFIRAVAVFIRDTLFYPLDNKQNPAAALEFKRHEKGCLGRWFYRRAMPYAWSFPNEVLSATKCGICIDTANLCTSLLRAGGVAARTVLGAVMLRVENQVEGYHAWTEVTYQGTPYIIETTIHHPDAETMVRCDGVYKRDSDWAASNGIYYAVEARYDESEYTGVGALGAQMPKLMGLPAIRVQHYGVAHTLDRLEHRQREMREEWRRAEALKHITLTRVYGGV